MKVIRVTPDQIAIVEYIIKYLVSPSGETAPVSHLQSIVDDERTFLLAAILEDKVIGYALAYRFPSLYEPNYLAYLYDIEVLSNYRRMGAGRLLMKMLLSQLKLNGVAELWLGTATDNTNGKAFFIATGGSKSDETFVDFTYEL